MASFTYDFLLVLIVGYCVLTDWRGGVMHATVRLIALGLAIWSLATLVPVIAPQLTVFGDFAGFATAVLILFVFHFVGNQFANMLQGHQTVVHKAHNSLLSLFLGFTRGNIYGVLLILTTVIMPTEHGKAFWQEGFLSPYYRGFLNNIVGNGWFPHTSKDWIARLEFTPDQQLVLYRDPTVVKLEQQPKTSYTKNPNEALDMVRSRKLDQTVSSILEAEHSHYQYTQTRRAVQEEQEKQNKRKLRKKDAQTETVAGSKEEKTQKLSETVQILCALNEDCNLDLPDSATSNKLRELITEIRTQLRME